jgi:hypothetical protein
VPGLELDAGANVEDDQIARTEPLQEFLPADRLHLLAQVVARSALHVGQPGGRDALQ